jgi:TRAP-type uncharacterized transport system fused permease subunit
MTMAPKKQLLHYFHHLILAGVLLLKGYDKYHHHHFIGGLIFTFGLLVLAYFLYMVIKRRESHTMHIVIHFFEALAALFTAYIYFDEGKKYLQYGMLLAALGFLIGAFVTIYKVRKQPAGQH